MNFTEEQCIQLCKEVEKHPVLYDYEHQDRNNRSANARTWESISRELNIEAAECKYKWQKINGSYVRSKRRQMYGKDTKDYFLSSHLEFLKPQVRPSKARIPRQVSVNIVRAKSALESMNYIALPASPECTEVSLSSSTGSVSPFMDLQENSASHTPEAVPTHKIKIEDEDCSVREQTEKFLESIVSDIVEEGCTIHFRISLLNFIRTYIENKNKIKR